METMSEEKDPLDISDHLDISTKPDDDIKVEEEFIEINTGNENKCDTSVKAKETEETKPSTDEVQKDLQVESVQDDSENTSDKIVSEDKPDSDDEGIESVDENKSKENEDVNEKGKKGDFEDEEEVIEETAGKGNKFEFEGDDDDVIEETRVIKNVKKIQEAPTIPVSKDSSTFRMHLTKEEIDKMIKDGTLEKVGEGHYRVRPESVKNLKSTPLALAKELDLDKTIKTIPISGTAVTNVPVKVQEPTANVLGTSVAASLPATQISTLPLVQQTPLIALMPINQVSAPTNNNAFIALPMQQNPTTMAYTTTLPTFVAISQTATPTQTTASTSLVPTVSSEIKVVSTSGKTVEKPEILTVVSKSTPKASKSSTSEESTKSAAEFTDVSPKVFNVPVVSSGVKRKPLFDVTKVKRPYKFAKLSEKPKRKSALRNIVSDINSSDEEEDGGLSKCKTYGAELASMFFKKIGEPKSTNKSLLDKIHKAIFNDPESESDQESNSDSEIEEIVERVKTGKADHHIVNCPGPSKFEASIGPGNSSKLSIVRCQEVRRTKNAVYELYKVKVISAGREGDTNILIPVPEGYKLNFPAKPREEPVEFSHTPHEDSESLNNVSPLFLEKLVKTELKLRKYKDQIKVLRDRYIELLQEYSNRPQFSTVSDLVGSAAKFLTEDQLVFFLMQIKAGAHNMQGIRYSVREKVLALSIYQKSPEVYEWLSKLFNLPSKRILDQWLEEVGSQDPKLLKKLMYHIYVSYNFKADV